MSVDESPFTTSFVPFTVLPACGTALSGGVAAAPRPVPRCAAPGAVPHAPATSGAYRCR